MKQMTTTTKKYKADVQRLGISREIFGEQMDNTVNATKQKDTCLFYQANHRYLGFNIRLNFCAESLEYKLSLDTPNVSIALMTRLAKSMPVVTHYEETTL